MARGKVVYRKTPFFWRQLLWKVTLMGLLLLILSQVALIWIMAAKETEDAFLYGRRLIVALDSGAIEGKIISSAEPEEPAKEPVTELDAKENESVKEPENQHTPPATAEPEKPADKPETKAPEQEDTEIAKEDAQPEQAGTVLVSDVPDDMEEFPAITPSIHPPADFSLNLVDKTEFGPLPKIASDGTKPWKYYSKPVVIKEKKPMIAIILTGLGNNKNTSEQALRLPEAINLSFSPYAKDLNSWMTSSRLSGHEILLDLPMEASNYPVSDPGPLGLLVSKDQPENENKIKRLMAHDVGYIGFITPQDEAFLGNNELFKSLLQVLSGRGLMLVVGRQPGKNETKDIIEQGNTANVIADTLVDEELTPTAIDARLSLLEQTAKQRGYAVGVARSYPLTIKQLAEWAAKSEENGFMLVPVSHVVSKRY